MESIIRDIKLAKSGHEKISWVNHYMPALNAIGDTLKADQTFKGKTVAVSVHLEAKTAYLAEVLHRAGAKVIVTGSNPLSTQDDVAAALVEDGLTVYATHACTDEEYFGYLNKALDHHPDIIIDDGGDQVNLLHTTRADAMEHLLGGTEETTTGVNRLHGLDKAGKLKFPMIAANDSYCKYLFDNRYGTGQSTWDGIMRTTNLTVVGKRVVIAGYGWCGRGCAMRAKGLGAHVIVTEVDPIKAIEAVFDGFEVMTMEEAAKVGDIFVTLTGDKDVIRKEHLEKMHDGVILANAGHFDVEINKNDLNDLAVRHFEARHNIEGYELADGRILNLLAEGRLVNLAAGDGHPAEIMDLSFAVQALAAKYILDHHAELGNHVYVLPHEIDTEIAKIKLESMGYHIDTLSEEQRQYLNLD
ncbi:adenosylhomocysteinase [Megasphaera hominis]|jgi:adenosylhomocysteinase|uniref:Adenosylhomocysteinase n=1 Tax=Megasphaera hominis TaxID=159836 RepID=A0ABR6VHI8_9FIRM|nr:adenosylhomocysteinase [Megasphaera hominis]MBC3536681.1 adenosylhomocysteinase [Megasphaera hominis]